LCDDLIFTSPHRRDRPRPGRDHQDRPLGRGSANVRPAAAPQGVIVDLANPGLVLADLMAWLRQNCTPMPRVIAYGSHVDTATLKRAREAGCDVVLPRSKSSKTSQASCANGWEPQRPAD